MRRSASEIIRNLEMRVAKLEKQAGFTVGQEVPYNLSTLKNLMSEGYGFKVISVGGGLSDTIEGYVTPKQAVKIISRGKVDLMVENIDRDTRSSIEPFLKRKGRENFIVITDKPLGGRIARLERSTMKKARSSMPRYAENQLLDEIYEEMGIDFDLVDIRDIDSKSISGSRLIGGGSSIFLVEVGKGLFAVVKCYYDEQDCDVLEITKSKRSALHTYGTAR